MTEATAISAVFSAYDTGVRYFDTAPWYGRTRSERRLGLALNNYDRSKFRLQTKVGRYLVPGQPNDRDSTGAEIINPAGGYPDGGHTTPGSPFGVTHDYSYDAIIEQHAHSLQRLGVSYVDSVVIHDLDLVSHISMLGTRFCVLFGAFVFFVGFRTDASACMNVWVVHRRGMARGSR